MITKREYTAGRLLETFQEQNADEPRWAGLDALIAADVMLPLLGH